jgi:hypothetical protein
VVELAILAVAVVLTAVPPPTGTTVHVVDGSPSLRV